MKTKCNNIVIENHHGAYLVTAEDENGIEYDDLFQTDSDWPGLARDLGSRFNYEKWPERAIVHAANYIDRRLNSIVFAPHLADQVREYGERK